MYCNFQRKSANNIWRCHECGATAKASYTEPPRAWCKASEQTAAEYFRHGTCVAAEYICPFHRLVSSLTPGGIDRLQQCRRISCDQLRTNSGVALCGKLTGSQCKALGRFVEFLNGDEACEFWT